MQKINVSGHELEIKKEYVEEFERTVCDSLEKMAKIYLLIEFEERNIEEIFIKHTKKEIIEAIMRCSEEEIALFNGEL